MTLVCSNPALQQLLSAATGAEAPGWRETVVEAGQAWGLAGTGAQSIWLPECGVWVLEQSHGNDHADVALLHARVSPVVPLQDGMRVRALSDGVAWVVPLCPDLLLQYQQGLLGQMARWAWCVQHHAPAQRLAGCLLWMHEACADASGWPLSAMPGVRQLLPAQWDRAVRALLHSQAVRVNGDMLQVQDQAALQRQACTCHTALAHVPAVL